MRARIRFFVACLMPIWLAAAPSAYGDSESIVAGETPDGDVLVTLMGTTHCSGFYTLPFTDYTGPVLSPTGTDMTATTRFADPGPPCQASPAPVPYSATIGAGHLANGTYNVTWTFVRGTGPGSSVISTFTGSFTVPTGTLIRGVAISPPSLSFGGNAIGTSSQATITVTNLDSVPHYLDVYTGGLSCPASGGSCDIPPGWYTDFAFTTDCSRTLGPHASCTINVTFAPTGGGTRTSGITVYPAGIFSTPPITLAGLGVAAAVDPASVPTLSESALMLLGFATLAIGAVASGRR